MLTILVVLTAFLQSNHSRELKVFVMENLPVETIQKALQGRDTDDIRRLLSGFSLPQALGLTSEALGTHERRMVRGREVYERLCEKLPETLEHVIYDKEVPNYFAVLGVPRNSDTATIKRSYRLLADMYHTDHFMSESEESRDSAKARLKMIVEAHKVLTNEELRREYFQAIPNRVHLYPKGPWFDDLPSLNV